MGGMGGMTKEFIHSEKIMFTESIVVASPAFIEVPHYTRNVILPAAMEVVRISLHIPFTGCEQPNARSRLLLVVNGVPQSDCTMHCSTHWELIPVDFHCTLHNVPAGPLNIVLQACSQSKLNVPHFNGSLIEGTLEPKMFASLDVVGIPVTIMGPRQFVHTEQIPFHKSITVGRSLAEVPHYTRDVVLPKAMEVVRVHLHIPFSGGSKGGRSRVLLYVNGVPQADCSSHGGCAWQLVPLDFHCTLTNVPSGPLRIAVMACSENDFNMPHYNTGLLEATVAPPMFATLEVIGM
jgi:rubredoxin